MAEEKKIEETETPAKAEPKKTAKSAASKGASKEGAAKEAKAESAALKTEGPAKTGKAKGKKKAKRRIVPDGRAYIQASFNNTMITITDPNGEVLAWGSAGSSGFKGPKKATPYAAQVSAEKVVEKAKVYGLERVHVFIKGAGNGREQAMRGLQNAGLNIESITDVTAVAHNGCRPRKSRRV